MRLELTDYNNMCSMIVSRETSKWWTFLYRMFVVFFYFYFCNRFQYQQFSKLTSFCRINVLILVFGILLIKCIAKMHKITEDTTNNSITIFFTLKLFAFAICKGDRGENRTGRVHPWIQYFGFNKVHNGIIVMVSLWPTSNL